MIMIIDSRSGVNNSQIVKTDIVAIDSSIFNDQSYGMTDPARRNYDTLPGGGNATDEVELNIYTGISHQSSIIK